MQINSLMPNGSVQTEAIAAMGDALDADDSKSSKTYGASDGSPTW